MENTTLINYIRNDDRQPCGVVVVVREGDNVSYGYSICNPIDKWDRKKGVKIAVARAIAGSYNLPIGKKNHDKVLEGFRHISNRAVKYFKDLSVKDVEFVFENDIVND
jgi:hypothetical protein